MVLGVRHKKTNEFPEKGWSKSGLSCSIVSVREEIYSVDELKQQLIWYGLEQSTFLRVY